ncbi:MAG: radical SAM protein [Phycisphaerales bacterium]|nr:radical SAM protein [Phycisphaerales bacterium]
MNGKILKFLTLNVTESCDATCIYCDWWRTKTAPESFNALADAVDQAALMGVRAIRISGGEPLLRPDLPSLVAHIRQHGLVSMVCTAAKCELSTLLALIDAGLDVLSVSLDTLDPRLFRRIRGYEIAPVLENLRCLAELRGKAEYEIVLSVVLTRLSIDGLADILEYAQKYNLPVNITPVQIGPCGRNTSKDAVAFGVEDAPILRNAMRVAKEAVATGLRIINSDEYLDGIAVYMVNRRLPAGYSCHAGDSTAIRLAGGKLKLCHSLKEIQGTDLAATWTSGEAENLRKRMASLDCPGCWLSCHADTRRPVAHRYGRPEIWEAL